MTTTPLAIEIVLGAALAIAIACVARVLWLLTRGPRAPRTTEPFRVRWQRYQQIAEPDIFDTIYLLTGRM